MTTNATILEIKAAVEADGLTIERLVTEWCNALEVDVDQQGDIW